MGLENPIHLLLILVVALMVFGAKRLPEMGRSLGDGMRGFKDALSGAADTGPAEADAREATPAEADLPRPIPVSVSVRRSETR